MALDNNYNGLTTLKDWWGKVKANFTYLDNRISTIITTPIDGEGSAQELVDARKGEATLGAKIDKIDAAHATHEAEHSYLQEEEPTNVNPTTLWFAIGSEANFSGGGVSIQNAETSDTPPETNIWFEPI